MTGEATLLKPSEVARRLAVSRSWVYAAAAEGRIPSIRVGGPTGPLRFVESKVDAWLSHQDQQHAREASGEAGDSGRSIERR